MSENKFIFISSSIFLTNKFVNFIRYSRKQPATLSYIELQYSLQIWGFSDNWLKILISFGFEKELISTCSVETSRSVLIIHAQFLFYNAFNASCKNWLCLRCNFDKSNNCQKLLNLWHKNFAVAFLQSSNLSSVVPDKISLT